MCRAEFSSSDGKQAQEEQLSPAASRGILDPNLALSVAPHLPACPGLLFLLFSTSPSSRTAPVFQGPLGHKQHKGGREETPPRARLSPRCQLAPGHGLSRPRDLPGPGGLRPGCRRSRCLSMPSQAGPGCSRGCSPCSWPRPPGVCHRAGSAQGG